MPRIQPEPHPLADLPTPRRIDLVMAVLSAKRLTPEGGWSLPQLAELCGCSQGAIIARQRRAIAAARRAAERLGLDPNDLRQLP